MARKYEEREAEFTRRLKKWLMYNLDSSFGAEAKVAVGGRWYFKGDKSFIKERRNLEICGRVFVYKFTDISRLGTPFDIVKLKNAPGYIFIQFNYDKKNKTFYTIEISDFNNLVKDGRKSITEEDAINIGQTHTLS